MIGVYVTVPVACWRKGKAREYLESERLPPPSTCYGFLLSLVGETDRRAHIGARVTVSLIGQEPKQSVVLRTMWRVKKKPLGSPGNTRPDYQQLLTGSEMVIWLDSTDEMQERDGPTLEDRVQIALDPRTRGTIRRFGGLSLGESTHMVNQVGRFQPRDAVGESFIVRERGQVTLPVWVDHVGSAGTRFVTGTIETHPLTQPALDLMPIIRPA